VLPSSEVGSWRSKHPGISQLRAYEQLLDAFFIFSPRYSQLPNNVSINNIPHVMSQLSTDLYRSPLRHENPRTYPDPNESRPLTWWFLTVSHEYGAQFRESFPSATDFACIVPYVCRLCVAECEQRLPHIHGIFQCVIPVTQCLMQNALRDYGWLTVEPIHTSPAASATYILHQKTGVLWELPNPGELQRMTREEAYWPTLVASRRQDFVPGLIPKLVREGIPWYVLKSSQSAALKAVRVAARNESRRRARAVRRSWHVRLVEPEDPEDEIRTMVAMFGRYCVRSWTNRFAAKWSGEPVIICSMDDQKDCQAFVEQHPWPITHIVLMPSLP
jgi:hypothetical protein